MPVVVADRQTRSRSLSRAALVAAVAVAVWPGGPIGPSMAQAAAPQPVCSRTLLLHNRHTDAVVLDIGGSGPRRLAAQATARFCAASPEVAWTVRQSLAASAWQWRGQAVLAEGERRMVEIDAPAASLNVRNYSGEPQRLAVDGTVLADVAAGQSVTLGPLPAGLRRVVASSQRRAAFWGASVSLTAGQTAALSLPRPSAVLELRNPLTEEAALDVDGLPFGRVAAAGQGWVVGQTEGRHVVRWVGVRSGAVQTQEAEAGRGGQLPEVTVAVVNQSGERLQLPDGLRHWGTSLSAGERASWRLPRGDFGVDLQGEQSGLRYHLDVRRSSPAELSWTVRRPTALLRLVNRSSDRVEVDVPILGPLPIAPGKRAVLRVPAGRLALQARAEGRAQPYRTGLMLQGGEQATWEIRAHATYTVAVNRWNEPIELWVDGLRTARIAAGQEMRIPLVAGAHHLEARVARLGWSERVTLQVRDGDTWRTLWTPPTSAVRLDNRLGPEALELWSEGVHLATAETATVVVDVLPAGRPPLRLRGAQSGQQRAVQVDLEPAQTAELPQLPWAAVQLIVRTVEPSLQVQLDGGVVQAVTTGELVLAGVAPGRHVLRLVDAGRVVWAAVDVDGRRPQTVIELRRSRR